MAYSSLLCFFILTGLSPKVALIHNRPLEAIMPDIAPVKSAKLNQSMSDHFNFLLNFACPDKSGFGMTVVESHSYPQIQISMQTSYWNSLLIRIHLFVAWQFVA